MTAHSDEVLLTKDLAAPIAHVPLLHRKVMRTWLQPVSDRNTLLALAFVALDYVLFIGAVAGTLWADGLWLKLLFGALAGVFIARLFVIGHDACHQSFTAHRGLNRWLGRLVFLPSLTPYSLWEVGHNVVHHGYTNLRGFDFVWEPRTLGEYQALPRWRRTLERAYRSGWTPWLYYLVEVWWLRMYFPSRRYMPTRRRVFFWDCVLVSASAALWIGALAVAAHAVREPTWLALAAGFALPFLVWTALVGFVVYVHHTHTAIAWHADKTKWQASQPFVSTTVHLIFRRWLGLDFGALLHHIFEHTAHHVDMGVPLYRLRQAQRILEERMPGRIVVQNFSWRWYFETARCCKLFDYEQRCWTDFSGYRTASVGAGRNY